MVFYFNKVLLAAERYKEPFPLIAIYNGMGIHSLNSALNYNEALSWYYKGLEVAYDHDDMLNYTILLSNIVWVYYLRHDPEGLRYAEEAYRLGKEMGSDYALYFGTLSCAYMYYVAGDLDKALDYVRETGYLSEKIPGMNNVDAFHAMILARQGRYEEAGKYFKSAFSDTDNMDVTTLIDAYQMYGDFLQGQGRYAEAVESYLKGLDISESHYNFFCILRLYKGLADA
ncbi:MAG: tetratricopeptide repeat protein [Bacteroidetes bacterium]|uniref:Tetratricopeptide repeat protein n=1 Tax=Candidatus Merdivivens pullistercoris TaxID=2840873 RepID=A0A9D9I474_9BACT|nr:tetratricopeptide repeat protein [Candidatus Merdivivens pullistercoris]